MVTLRIIIKCILLIIAIKVYSGDTPKYEDFFELKYFIPYMIANFCLVLFVSMNNPQDKKDIQKTKTLY